ncbi:MAG TPA: hypothetical protein VFU16_07730 [Solirubrobacterales bacterium]|nr:hypothetical protein [Solirubrobacterales bacterium]
MDLTRLLLTLGIFLVAFAYLYWRLRRERDRGVEPDESSERLTRWTVRGSSTVGLAVAAVLLLAGIAEGSLPIVAAALALIAFQLWRRSTA